MPNGEYAGILIYAQMTRENYIHTVFFELVDKAKELSQKLGGAEINAVIFSPDEPADGFKQSFRSIGVDKVYSFVHREFKNYSTEYYSKLIADLVNKEKPEIFLIGATTQGRDLAPRISSKLGAGLTADCTALDINEKGQLTATRPTFGGELMAAILSRSYPQMATVRPGVFKVHLSNEVKETKFIKQEFCLSDIENHVKILEFKKTKASAINNLDNAEIIVAGGMGLKNEKGFELLKRFSNKIGGVTGATRSAVEMGLAPAAAQIGQTGKTVRPKIYIACGISGAVQHTVGMENSEYIIAINNDPNAPIFDIADTGIVGDFFEIIPKFLELE